MTGLPFIRIFRSACLPQVAARKPVLPGDRWDGVVMSDDQKRKLLSTSEAATYCGGSASTFEKLRCFGGGPAYVKLGRRVAYSADDLDAWIASNRRRSTSEPRSVVS